MLSRKVRTDRIDGEAGRDEADWKLVCRPGIGSVRFGVGANAEILAEQREEFGGKHGPVGRR